MKMKIGTVKAGYANMFLSPTFRSVFATVTDSPVELYTTDGAQGAARGAGIGAGIFASPDEAFIGLEKQDVIEPDAEKKTMYADLYQDWKETLEQNVQLKN